MKVSIKGAAVLAVAIALAAVPLFSQGRGSSVVKAVAATTHPQDVCPPKWEAWAPVEGPPFRFQYRSAAGDRPPSSTYAPYCLLYELRNTPGRLAVRVDWFAQDGKSLLLRAELEECLEKDPERCPASSSSRSEFSKDFLPSLIKFGARFPGDKDANGSAWQRRPTEPVPAISSRFPTLPASARGVVLNNEGKVDFRFAFRAYSSVTPADGGWTITNEVETADPAIPLLKNVTVGPQPTDKFTDDPVLVWNVRMGPATSRQQLSNGFRAVQTVKQPAVSLTTRLEIRVRNEVRFALTLPAYVDGTPALPTNE